MVFEGIYVVSGLILAAYYAPQILACATDRTGLVAYSLSKAFVQLLCRGAMLPWVWITVDSTVMLVIQGLDFTLRGAEFAAAVSALRRQGWGWRRIGLRATHRSHSDEAPDAQRGLEGA